MVYGYVYIYTVNGHYSNLQWGKPHQPTIREFSSSQIEVAAQYYPINPNNKPKSGTVLYCYYWVYRFPSLVSSLGGSLQESKVGDVGLVYLQHVVTGVILVFSETQVNVGIPQNGEIDELNGGYSVSR